MEFKVGDVVRLKSGGPDMTVGGNRDPLANFGHSISCSWINEDGLQGAWFHPDMLEHATDDEDGFYEVEFEAEPYANLEAMDAYFAQPDPELTDEELDDLMSPSKYLKDRGYN